MYKAPYPSLVTLPSTAIFPALPDTSQLGTYLIGSNGTAVPVLVITGIDESQDTNTIVHELPKGPSLVDIRPWSAPVQRLTLIVPDISTYRALRDLYASGATVTVQDPGSGWDGSRHIIGGPIGYRALPIPGRSAALEVSIEVIAQ